MLKLTKKELDILYEGLNGLLEKESTDKPSYKNITEIIEIQKKLQSTKKVSKESLNESVQILDKVIHDKARGYVTGQLGDKYIVMVQGSSYLVDPSDLKEFNTKPELSTKPHIKFDEETQKLLFEQYIKCGIYQGSVPVKTQGCYVRYDQWNSARPDEQIKVIIEGSTTFVEKESVKLYENLNDFANPDNYVPGVLIDQATDTALENVLVNVLDYTETVGDADSVKIIRETPEGEQEIQTVPKAMVKTLTV